MDDIKVSVIIPVWGVEEYIEKCARHLFEQTLKEMEFIFVNDCTQDKSIEILMCIAKDYPERKRNIHIINHETNQGLPKARQSGLKIAKGEYIAHHDSDDWVDLELYEKMYDACKKEDAEIAVCPFKETDGIHEPTDIKVLPYVNNRNVTNRLADWENEGSLCNKIVKRELYNNMLIYPTQNMAEDLCMVYQLIYYCKKFVVVPNVHYYIYKNPQSITRIPTRENVYRNFLQAKENCLIVEEFYRRHDAIDKNTQKAILRLKFNIRETLRPIVMVRKYHKVWQKAFPEIEKTLLQDNGLTPRQKLKDVLILLRLFPLPWKRCRLKEK